MFGYNLWGFGDKSSYRIKITHMNLDREVKKIHIINFLENRELEKGESNITIINGYNPLVTSPIIISKPDNIIPRELDVNGNLSRRLWYYQEQLYINNELVVDN